MGKTAIVEGIAARIASSDVPPTLSAIEDDAPVLTITDRA